jgi:hypothetical protein
LFQARLLVAGIRRAALLKATHLAGGWTLLVSAAAGSGTSPARRGRFASVASRAVVAIRFALLTLGATLRALALRDDRKKGGPPVMRVQKANENVDDWSAMVKGMQRERVD